MSSVSNMISQNKIKRYISRIKNRDFKKEVEIEKKQKYLFNEWNSQSFSSKRNVFSVWKKQNLRPFSNFFQKWYIFFETYALESRLLGIIWWILLGLSAYIIFFSPYFEVSPSNVLIETITPWIDLNIAYRSIEDVYGKSLFFLNERETGLHIQKSLKNISHISLKKLYPNGLKIIITGAPIAYRANIFGLDRNWWLSENGVLIPNTKFSGSGTMIKDFEIISDMLKGELFLDYKQVLDDSLMKTIQNTVTLFYREFPNITVEKIRYFLGENELHFRLKNKWTIIFSLGNKEKNEKENMLDMRLQFISLLRYLQWNEGDVISGKVFYIDARISKKLFLCRDPIICRDNLITIYGQIYSRD